MLKTRLEKLEELLGVKNENRLILVIEDDYKFEDKEEQRRFEIDMSKNSLVVEISLDNVNKWRQRNEM
ncbi:hypothetical protein HYV87_02695 [Candidatus Woesearchaeota archaeon]|nr:hypothetical protein [Candidatus Woesearchaeota archaeon]